MITYNSNMYQYLITNIVYALKKRRTNIKTVIMKGLPNCISSQHILCAKSVHSAKKRLVFVLTSNFKMLVAAD